MTEHNAIAAGFALPPWETRDGRVSLVRPRREPRPLALAAEPRPLEVDLARSALVVIDMQNDFCHPQGWFGRRGADLARGRRVIPAIRGAVDAADRHGLPVVYVNWGVRADTLEMSPGQLAMGRLFGDDVGYGERTTPDAEPVLVKGSWGARTIDELTPEPHHVLVDKCRFSGFQHNELDAVLRRLDVTTLFFCGINTDRCVLATLQDATFLGYDAVLVEDATATASSDDVHDAACFLIRKIYGFTTTVPAFAGDAQST